MFLKDLAPGTVVNCTYTPGRCHTPVTIRVTVLSVGVRRVRVRGEDGKCHSVRFAALAPIKK
jgi:hypothetical protein